MPVTKQMIIEKVKMTSRQTVNLGKRIIDALRVEAAAALEKCILVTEVAMLRASARDDDGVRNEVMTATN